MKSNTKVTLIVALIAALLGFVLVAYFLSGGTPAEPVAQKPAVTQSGAAATTRTTADADAQRSPSQPSDRDGSSLSEVFGAGESAPADRSRPMSWQESVLTTILRLAVAAVLAALLAFRPRKDSPVLRRNLYVAQTQILLAVVAAALMMIVGDNAARAFGIFAAVSLVNFRTNIRDPKEITVLLISLSIGLATGVGRWELAVILSLFVLPLLWFLEYNEQEQVFRAMELTIKTRDTDATQSDMKEIFSRHDINAELRQLSPPDEQEPVGCVMYFMNMNLNTSTDQISDDIRLADPQNVEGIEWSQKKDSSYIYH